MAIIYPLSLATFFDRVPVKTISLKLTNNQEITGLGSGDILAAQLAPAAWIADIQFQRLYHHDALDLQALIETLDGSINSFYMYDPRKMYPAAYPTGNFFPGDNFNNVLINAGFETGVLAPWAPGTGVSVSTVGAHTGTYFLLMDKGAAGIGAGTQRETWQLYDGIVAGKQYYLGAWAIGAVNSLAGANLRVQWRNAANGVISTTNAVTNSGYTTAWQLLSGIVTAPALATRALVYAVFGTTGAAQHLLFDDFIFRRYEAFDGTNAQIDSLPANNKSLTLKGLPAGYQGSRGDMLSFDYATNPVRTALHRVAEPFVANGSGVTPAFEVRPHIRAGAAINLTVSVVKPKVKMMMIPDSLSEGNDTEKTTMLSFQARQRP